MKTTYVDTLEDMAARRRALGAAIVSVAAVAGVDPAPYLDAPPEVTDAEVDHVVDRLREARPAKAPKPPRPQQPASPSTNGAGLEDKVLSFLKNGPSAPKVIAEQTGIKRPKLFELLPTLVARKQIKKTGNGRSTEYQLA